MKRSDFRFLDKLRVRWAEVDMQKIVFNGHYLMYFDTAVGAYWRALALPYAESMEHLQGDLYVRKATLEYEGSAHYDEICHAGIRCARIGNSSLVLQTALFRGEQLLVHGELVYVFADPATQTSRPVPPALREILAAYEAGESMVTLQRGAWGELGAEAGALRREVFVDDLKWPAWLAGDDTDADALHAVVRNRLGRVVACGRLTRGAEAGQSQLSRMAVLSGLQGSGLGRRLLDELVGAARDRGDRDLFLHAHEGARAFYAEAGFTPRGEVYEEAGLPHLCMGLAL